MNSCRTRPALLLMLALVPIALCSCLRFRPAEDLTKFYVLSSGASSLRPLESASRVSLPVFVPFVEVAAYLENPSLAVRHATNEVHYLGFHHWAEPVRDGATRCLREDLAALLGANRVHTSSRRRPAGDYVEVEVILLRFELTDNGASQFSARWRIVRADTREVLASRRTDLSRSYAGSTRTYDSAVAALSDAVTDLSRQIAEALNNTPAR